MTRSERLLALMQSLRRRRVACRGADLADELGVSLRTVYRDIASLQAQGAKIVGDAGVGYLLQAGYWLPPLMFSQDEIEALVLGARWVSQRADTELATAAQEALTKIHAVLPADRQAEVNAVAMLIGPSAQPPERDDQHVRAIRRAIRSQRKLRIEYCDLKDQTSQRIVWPIALGFFESVQILVAWCEHRSAFRHFRTDRIQHLDPLLEPIPSPRHTLLKTWMAEHHIEQPTI